MEVEIIGFREGTMIDENARVVKFKVAKYRVNGYEHSVKISQKDFDSGKARKIIDEDAKKILAIYEKK